MLRSLTLITVIILGLQPAWASDLTDAILGIDPPQSLESGQNLVYEQAYGPRKPEQNGEEDLLGVAGTGDEYSGLRSTLADPEGYRNAFFETDMGELGAYDTLNTDWDTPSFLDAIPDETDQIPIGYDVEGF